jgi:hypothetical protein
MSPSPRGIDIVASSAKESRDRPPFAANKGAGGRGLLGEPPYLLDGVPGLGAPFISEGSNERFGGGLLNSPEPLVSQERVGDALPLWGYGLYDESGGIIEGAKSIIDGARECEDVTVGWYDLRGVTGLVGLMCKLDLFFNCNSRVDKGDLIGVRRDLLREGPSGIFGSSVTNASLSETARGDFLGDFHRNLKLDMLSSSSLRVSRCSGVDMEVRRDFLFK